MEETVQLFSRRAFECEAATDVRNTLRESGTTLEEVLCGGFIGRILSNLHATTPLKNFVEELFEIFKALSVIILKKLIDIITWYFGTSKRVL